MRNRTTTFVSAILVSSLAGFAIATASHQAAFAADTCLAGPKDATPAGSHWYYRVERGTKRHCWYLGDQRGKTSQAASARPPTSAKADLAQAAPPLQPTAANARAEFIGSPANNDSANASPAAQPAPAPDSIPTDSSQHTAPQGADAQPATVTSRWPDPSSNRPYNNLAPHLAAKSNNDAQPAAQRTVPSPAPSIAPRVAGDPAPRSSSYSIPTLLVGLAGALALAGLLGFAVVRFGGASRFSRRKADHRNSVWDVVDDNNPPPWMSHEPTMPPSDPRPVKREIDASARQADTRRVTEPGNDILEILSRASRSAAT